MALVIEPDSFYSREEILKLLNISPELERTLKAEKKLVPVILGKRHIYSGQSIINFLQSKC